MGKLVYKVLPESQWQQAVLEGFFRGSGIDMQDGFIHLSAADQVEETVARYFAGQTDLVLVELDEDDLKPHVRWESSRGGDLFPHVYGEIAVGVARRVSPLPLGSDGKHQFPEGWSGSG